jgi:transposase-like protein
MSKLEIIRLVEQSALPVRQTLEKIGIPRATFYRWYDFYRTGGPEALDDRHPTPDRVWNRIPNEVRQRIVDLALDEPMSLRSRHANWRCASPTPRAILSRRHRYIGCSRPTI